MPVKEDQRESFFTVMGESASGEVSGDDSPRDGTGNLLGGEPVPTPQAVNQGGDDGALEPAPDPERVRRELW